MSFEPQSYPLSARWSTSARSPSQLEIECETLHILADDQSIALIESRYPVRTPACSGFAGFAKMIGVTEKNLINELGDPCEKRYQSSGEGCASPDERRRRTGAPSGTAGRGSTPSVP